MFKCSATKWCLVINNSSIVYGQEMGQRAERFDTNNQFNPRFCAISCRANIKLSALFGSQILSKVLCVFIILDNLSTFSIPASDRVKIFINDDRPDL